jgi:hypothetical protein
MAVATTIRDRAPALRRIGMVLSATHVLVASWAWWRTLGRGWGQADVVGAAYALLLSAFAASLVATWPVVARRGARAAAAWVAAAALALPVVAWLATRSAEPRYRYEVAISSGLYDAPDGAFHWSVTLAEPFTSGHHALLELERDGRPATLPIALRRSPRDNVAPGAWGLALRPLGRDRYWLAVGTAWARAGPQYFLLEWSGTAPRVREVKRGLAVEDGHARWDCAEWGAEARGAPEPDAVCREDGTLPPVRACQLERLAAACGSGISSAAGCQPELAGELPAVMACLERRARDGDPLAWDALVLATTVARDGHALYDLLTRSRAAEQPLDPACAALRHGARQLAAGRRLGRWWEWVRLDGATNLLAARGTPGAERAHCPALPPVAAELALDSPALAWDAVQSAREAARDDDSCVRVLAMAARGEIDRLAPPRREAARAWHAACVARQLPPGPRPASAP